MYICSASDDETSHQYNTSDNYQTESISTQMNNTQRPYTYIDRPSVITTNRDSVLFKSNVHTNNALFKSLPKKKKNRTKFTQKQLLKLEEEFYAQKYLSKLEYAALAKSLNMNTLQVKTWFQNRR
jgi:hypothetical protein